MDVLLIARFETVTLFQNKLSFINETPFSNIHSFVHQWPYRPLLGPGRFFSFIIMYTVGRTLWTGDQPVARPLPTHRTTQTQNKRTQTSMSGVGFQPTARMLERAKTVQALDRAATVIGFLTLRLAIRREKYGVKSSPIGLTTHCTKL
jgi:hypothetical protein